MGKFFWGFFFIYLNFNLTVNAHALNVLPPFVGYILLYKGLVELDAESGVFAKIKPFAVGMAVYTGILWCGDLLAVTGEGNWVGMLLSIAATVVSLYISWAVIQGVRDMEKRRGTYLNGAEMQRAWWVLLISQIAAQVLARLLSVLAIAAVVVTLIGIGLLLVAFWKGKDLYEALPPLSGEAEPEL